MAILDQLSITPEDFAHLRRIWEEKEPQRIALLVGTREWIERERSDARAKRRRFVAVKAIKREYGKLNDMEVRRINASAKTTLGMELDAPLINYLELVLALRILPETQRHCWTLNACEGMAYPQIAAELAMGEEAVERAVSHAGGKLVRRIFDPLTVRLHIGASGSGGIDGL